MHRRTWAPAQAAAAAAAAVKRSAISTPSPSTVARNLEHVPTVTVSTLRNGTRVVSEQLPHVNFCNVGVWIDAGSRLETLANNGTAHFLEHLNFKGSPKYTKHDIDTLFEHNGSHFNAYTARDRTAYYVKAFNKHVDASIRLVSDILCNSNLEPRFIEAERPTILAEMRDVESLVDEVIMDNLHLAAFDAETSGLPLTILGPVRNINERIDRAMLRQYVDTHYTGPRMNLVCSGGLPHSEVEKLAEAHLGWLPSTNHRPAMTSQYVGGDHVLWSNTMTSNMAWAVPICGMRDPDCLVLQVVHQILGAYRRDFRTMFSNLRDTCYNGSLVDDFEGELEMVNPFFTPYEETGLFGFYYVTVPSEKSPDVLDRLLQRNLLQLQMLAVHQVDADRLERIKVNFKAAHLLVMDGTTNRCEEIGRQIIQSGRFESSKELFARLDAITPEKVREVVARYFVNARPTVSLVGQPETLFGYDSTQVIRSKVDQALLDVRS